ncbi:hypothetical protein Y032_0301g1824 [Ancylostoma ceylanicum]|uniref:MT-A70 protein n=1 Tax=Ancylostoma ceylanicum TaxID=53326 RepID=A0A016S465_9BILA|nr:hypothetical protein Y032_0301g1824 [Ancylostoma ceylanicum]
MTSFNVVSTKAYDIIDECSYYNELYKNVRGVLDEHLFMINGPFMMDSQFNAMKREGRRVRKRKKPISLGCSEEIAAIESISKEVRKEGWRIGYFSEQSTHDNNRMARNAARDLVERSFNFYRPRTISSAELILLEDNRSDPEVGRFLQVPEDSDNFSDFVIDREYCMLNSWYRNQSDSVIRLNVSLSEGEPSTKYYMPPQSTFHIGAVTDVRDFTILNEENFDLILMDPPWENLSVKRQQSYVTSDSAISNIDMDCLDADGLLAVWITNRKGIDQDLEVHLKRWNLKRLATFIWLKVTREGDPICPFNSSHKLPYEKLVLASRAEAATRYASIAAADGKVFASVPMALPSRKPPVAILLKQFGISPNRCLELFARCLQPNTVSVGFETLLLQSSSCLVPSEFANS